MPSLSTREAPWNRKTQHLEAAGHGNCDSLFLHIGDDMDCRSRAKRGGRHFEKQGQGHAGGKRGQQERAVPESEVPSPATGPALQ
jgi:hypothetical protein